MKDFLQNLAQLRWVLLKGFFFLFFFIIIFFIFLDIYNFLDYTPFFQLIYIQYITEVINFEILFAHVLREYCFVYSSFILIQKRNESMSE